jgi:serine/threonine protein kinase
MDVLLLHSTYLMFNHQLRETAEGLSYLHEEDIVHGDLRAVSAYVYTFRVCSSMT